MQGNSFLPAINAQASIAVNNNYASAAPATKLQATGMSGLRTGQSFMPTRNNFQAMTGRLSPIRQNSITAQLSPRQMVQQFTRRGSEDFGIEGYQMPMAGSPKSKKNGGVIGKNKSPGPIEAEVRLRKNQPGAGTYTIQEDLMWTERMSPRKRHADFATSPRVTEAEEIEKNSKRPEKCTPSPNDYKTNYEKFLPNLGRGGGSLLMAKAEKVTSMAECKAIGRDTPGPMYKITETSVFKKRNLSVQFASGQTQRLAPIKKNESTDFFETNDAAIKNQQKKSPLHSFSRQPKRSFAEQASKAHKGPGVGAYKVTERAFKMLSPSPGARRR